MSRLAYSLGVLVLVLCAAVGVRVSSAEFTDGSVTRTQIGAARDWTPPTVSVDNPGNSGNVVNGTVTVTANATDAETSVASVLIEVAAEGSSSWSTLCTDSAAPWACSWDSTTVADGNYRLRATATDVDGNSATSAEIAVEVINTMRVHLEPIDSPARGTITMTARFYNSGGMTVSMRIQAYVPGTGWTDVPGCGPATGTVRTCTYDTTGLTSATYDVRVVATVFWWTFTDTQTGVVIDNAAPTVSQSLSGSTYLSGTISWSANATDTQTGIESVTFEYRRDAGAWETCATDTSSPYSCGFDAATLAEGSYEFRAVATDHAGNTQYSGTITRIVDNEGPAVTLSVPAGPISGPVAMTATATDAGAGMTGGSGGVQFQYRPQGVTGWSSCGTDTTSPYACTTGTLANGTYEFRAVATNANNRATASDIETRVVDTVISSVSLTAPTAGATIWGSTTVTASASSNKGVNSVTLQYKTGTGAWTNVCDPDTGSPYSCTWDTAALPYGSYQLQAVMSHGSGLTQTSAPVTVTVPQPRGWDVQGSTSLSSTPSTGDTIVLTYTDAMDLSTIASGLTTTTPRNATATLVGNYGSTTMTFSGANLGTVVFDQQYVDYTRTVNYAVTVSASTSTANGVSVTRITVTLGSRTSGLSSYLNSDSSLGFMTWAPSAAAADPAGNAASTATTTETGTADRDL